MKIRELQKEFDKDLSNLRQKPHTEKTLREESRLRDHYQVLFLTADYDQDFCSKLSIFQQICIAAGIRRPENVQVRI